MTSRPIGLFPLSGLTRIFSRTCAGLAALRHRAASRDGRLPGRLHRAAAAVLLPAVLGLTACAGLQPPGATRQGSTADLASVSPAPLAAASMRRYQERIAIGGRLSMRYQQNGSEQALHGSFTWAQEPGRTTVAFLSPLGQTLATIVITPTTATLSQAGRASQSARDVDALAAQTLGWPIPISGLRLWLQGFAVGSDGRQFSADPQGPDQATTGDGWRIRYATWRTVDDPQAASYPGRIDLEHGTGQAGVPAAAGPIALRIVIDYWQPG